jgi:hypothetical protein
LQILEALSNIFGKGSTLEVPASLASISKAGAFRMEHSANIRLGQNVLPGIKHSLYLATWPQCWRKKKFKTQTNNVNAIKLFSPLVTPKENKLERPWQ